MLQLNGNSAAHIKNNVALVKNDYKSSNKAYHKPTSKGNKQSEQHIHYHHTATAGTRQLLCSSFLAAIISPALCWSTRLLAWKLLVVYIHTRYPRRYCGVVNIPAELTHWIFLGKLILPHLKPKTQQLNSISKGVSKTNDEIAFKRWELLRISQVMFDFIRKEGCHALLWNP